MRRFRRLFLEHIVAFALVAGFNLSFILILLKWTEQYITATLGLGEIFTRRASSSTSSEFPSRASSETPGTGPSLSNGNDLLSSMLKVFRRFDERLLLCYTTMFRLLFVATVLLLNASRLGECDLFSKFTKCDKITPNPDIVGSGVRCSMYILLLFVSASLLVATFHRQQSGTKELGCFVLINYLAVVLMIDTQCVALSATLSSKDALASRCYVGFTLLGQTLAWVVVAYTNHVLAGSFSSAMNSCIATYWVHSSLGDAAPFTSLEIYWDLHALDFVHSGWLALRHTFQFDLLEKIDREQRGHTGNFVKPVTGFNSLRGTPYSNWLGFSLHPLLLIVTLESHMKGMKTAAWGDWGQMMPLTMLVLGVGHWFYLNLTQLWAHIKDRTSGPGDKLVIPLDTSRLIAMGYGSSETGEVVHRLLTAKRYDP